MMLRNGVDLVEVHRLAELKPGIRERFLKRVFTPLELLEADDSNQRLAGRFAVKEAVAKALGCGIGPISWQDIEVQNGPTGEPVLNLQGNARTLASSQGLEIWSISISHTKDYAVAMVVALGVDREAERKPDQEV
ncbi:MAG: holo-ACP synthase [Anaerolineaceae bacterium]|nr:holo-ACP synthase [Anaerolineaceae bacterium]